MLGQQYGVELFDALLLTETDQNAWPDSPLLQKGMRFVERFALFDEGKAKCEMFGFLFRHMTKEEVAYMGSDFLRDLKALKWTTWENVMSQACAYAKAQVLEWLFPFCDDRILGSTEAIVNLCQRGDKALVTRFQNVPWTADKLQSAFFRVLMKRDLNMAQFMMETFHDLYSHSQFSTLCCYNVVPSAQFLYERFPECKAHFNPMNAGPVFEQVCKNGSTETALWLEKTIGVPWAYYNHGYLFAITNDHIDTAEALQRDFDPFQQEHMMNHLCHYGNVDNMRYFLKVFPHAKLTQKTFRKVFTSQRHELAELLANHYRIDVESLFLEMIHEDLN